MRSLFPESEVEVGHSRPLDPKMQEKLGLLRKDAPTASDVHVDAPMGALKPKKQKKKRRHNQNIRVVKAQEAGRLPFGNAAAEASFAKALRAAFTGIPHPSNEVIARALKNNPDVYVRALGLEMFERRLQERLVNEYVQAARAEAEARFGDKPLAKAAVTLRFDVRNPSVLRWARTAAAKLVTAITEEIRAAVRVVITRMYREGIHPTNAIPLVRTALGDHDLFPRWANAVTNYGMKLRDQGVPEERVREMTGAYHERLADARANMIARTEIIAAQNEGRLDAWGQMVDAGILSKTTIGKKWDASHEGVCPVCDKLDGDVVGLDEMFSTGVPRPPQHPHCRCVVLLVER